MTIAGGFILFVLGNPAGSWHWLQEELFKGSLIKRNDFRFSDFPKVRWNSQANCGFLQITCCSQAQKI